MKQIAIITITLALVINYSWLKEINQIVNYLSWQNESSQNDFSKEIFVNSNLGRVLRGAVCKEYPHKNIYFGAYKTGFYVVCADKEENGYLGGSKNLIIIGDK